MKKSLRPKSGKSTTLQTKSSKIIPQSYSAYNQPLNNMRKKNALASKGKKKKKKKSTTMNANNMM